MSDFNSISVENIMWSLAEMDHNVVLSYLLEAIISMSHPDLAWDSLVEGICIFLTKGGGIFAEECIPALAGLLFSEKAFNTVDISFILEVFEYVGPTCSPFVLPGLAHILLETKDSDLLKQTHQLLSTFDEILVKPYLLTINRA